MQIKIPGRQGMGTRSFPIGLSDQGTDASGHGQVAIESAWPR